MPIYSTLIARPIAYVMGDATAPKADGPKIIVHVCNDVGAWGRGFVVALSRRWPEPGNFIARGIVERPASRLR